MPSKNPRRDPYKNFNFRAVIVAALVGEAALVIARTAKRGRRDPEAPRRNAYWRFFGLD